MGWVVNATPRPLYPRERAGTHCTGDWVNSGTSPSFHNLCTSLIVITLPDAVTCAADKAPLNKQRINITIGEEITGIKYAVTSGAHRHKNAACDQHTTAAAFHSLPLHPAMSLE